MTLRLRTRRDRFYDVISVLLFLALIIIVLVTFRDYGASWDEEAQHLYGGSLFRFYTSFGKDRYAVTIEGNLQYYGGFFELVSYVATLVSPLGRYETRHLLSALCGILGLFGCWKISRALAGP